LLRRKKKEKGRLAVDNLLSQRKRDSWFCLLVSSEELFFLLCFEEKEKEGEGEGKREKEEGWFDHSSLLSLVFQREEEEEGRDHEKHDLRLDDLQWEYRIDSSRELDWKWKKWTTDESLVEN
jgi:hypothetical protein